MNICGSSFVYSQVYCGGGARGTTSLINPWRVLWGAIPFYFLHYHCSGMNLVHSGLLRKEFKLLFFTLKGVVSKALF